jgi:hypothetical protein
MRCGAVHGSDGRGRPTELSGNGANQMTTSMQIVQWLPLPEVARNRVLMGGSPRSGSTFSGVEVGGSWFSTYRQYLAHFDT